jgi:hypothetical protein
MITKILHNKLIWSSLFFGFVTSWLVKEEITLLLLGKTFDGRSDFVKMGILISITVITSTIIYFLWGKFKSIFRKTFSTVKSKHIFKNGWGYLGVVFIIIVLVEVLIFNQEFMLNKILSLEARHYSINDGSLYQFNLENGKLVAQGEDPNITFDEINIPVKFITIKCTNVNPGGYGQVFYRSEGESFSESQSVIYDASLSEKTVISLSETQQVYSLRIDLINSATSQDIITCSDFVINPPMPFMITQSRLAIYAGLLLISILLIYIIKSIKNFLSIATVEQKTERFITHILIPLWILNLYLFSLSLLAPEGVTKAFAARSGDYALLVTIVLSLIFFYILRKKERRLFSHQETEGKFSSDHLILLLLPLTPVMQYILSNLEILSPLDAIYVFIIFVIFAAFFILLIPILFRKTGSSQILMCLGLAFTYSITTMGALSQKFTWHLKGSLEIQITVFASVFLLSWLFSHLKKQNFFHALIVIMFLSTSITSIIENNTKKGSETGVSVTENTLLTLVDSREPKRIPSIYLIVYDAYVVNETMLSHGIDNHAQEQYLEEHGFKIYPHSYSVAADSFNTMSRVLNASTELYGDRNKACAGDGVVQNLLKSYGYRTYGIFDYPFCLRGYGSAYDYSYPDIIRKSAPANDLVKAILVGEFLWNINVVENTDLATSYTEQRNAAFSEKTDYPKFVYTHRLMPGHSQNSGACLPDEGDIKIYNERLQVANLGMKLDVEQLLQNDPGAIIIFAGDHGGYLTKNCIYTSPGYDISEINRLDIQDRFGQFLAIRWPTQDFEEYDDITVLQDVFPAIFAYIFEDQELLASKVEPVTLFGYPISGAKVVDGIIEGGIHDGEPLFIEQNEK